MADQLSAYELKRAETIRQNKAVLASLDIKPLELSSTAGGAGAVSSLKKKTKTNTARGKGEPAPQAQRRVSRRIRNDTSDLVPEAVDKALSSFPRQQRKPRDPNAPPRAGTLPLSAEDGKGSVAFADLLDEIVNSATATNTNIKKYDKHEMKDFSVSSPGSMCRMTLDRIYSMAFNPSTTKVLVSAGSKYGTLAFWDATLAYEGRSFDGNDNDGSNESKSNDNESSTTSTTTKTINIMPYKRPCWTFSPAKEAISSHKYLNDRELVLSSYDGKVSLIDFGKGGGPDQRTVYQDNGRDIAMMDVLDTNILYITDMDGWTSAIDVRCSSSTAIPRYRMHLKKAGGLSVKGNWLATSSLDRTVKIWDIRSLREHNDNNDGAADFDCSAQPIISYQYARAVTSVAFQKDSFVERLALTCYDDTVRVISDPLSADGSTELVVPHNNQTGRWITVFKCCWNHRKSELIIGDMDRSLDLINGISGAVRQFSSPLLTAQPAVNAAHPFLDIMASGTATGRTFLWT